MKSIKHELGFSDVGFVLIIVAIVLVFVTANEYKNQKNVDFQTYFSIDPRSTNDKDLVRSLVNKRLEELVKVANGRSAMVVAIRNESESLTLKDLKDKIERLNEAKKIETSAWSDWERACGAAKWENYVQTCNAAK